MNDNIESVEYLFTYLILYRIRLRAFVTSYQDGFKQEKPSVNNAWIFKIPQAEIDANPNITPGDQN